MPAASSPRPFVRAEPCLREPGHCLAHPSTVLVPGHPLLGVCIGRLPLDLERIAHVDRLLRLEVDVLQEANYLRMFLTQRSRVGYVVVGRIPANGGVRLRKPLWVLRRQDDLPFGGIVWRFSQTDDVVQFENHMWRVASEDHRSIRCLRRIDSRHAHIFRHLEQRQVFGVAVAVGTDALDCGRRPCLGADPHLTLAVPVRVERLGLLRITEVGNVLEAVFVGCCPVGADALPGRNADRADRDRTCIGGILLDEVVEVRQPDFRMDIDPGRGVQAGECDQSAHLHHIRIDPELLLEAHLQDVGRSLAR